MKANVVLPGPVDRKDLVKAIEATTEELGYGPKVEMADTDPIYVISTDFRAGHDSIPEIRRYTKRLTSRINASC